MSETKTPEDFRRMNNEELLEHVKANSLLAKRELAERSYAPFLAQFRRAILLGEEPKKNEE
jgi:hypothetical protein